ncbi:MAG: ATP-binding protein [Leptospiraceae bacterium]|nr:ATP-binding protein [Leptospiraceae bacterium]MDW7975573.1 ATP-binding protein [Leptospiraceae bacterium]
MDKTFDLFEIYKNVFDHGDLAIFVFKVIKKSEDYDYQFLLTNQTHQKLTGITLKEIQNKYLMELKSIVPTEELKKIKEHYDTCAREKKMIEYEEEIIIKGKKTYWFTKLTPILHNGEVDIIIGASIDISKLKQYENTIINQLSILDILVKNTPVGIAITDSNFHIIFYNPRFLKIWELNEETLKSDKQVFFHMLKQIKNRKKVYPKIMEVVNKRKIGTIRYIRLKNKIIEFLIIPMYHDQTFSGYFGFYNDVTKDYVYKKRLKKMLIQLRLANKSKSEFLANISHELRTPLTTIIGLTDIIKNHIKESSLAKYISIIEESSQVLLNIIQDLLDLSSIELGTVKIQNQPFLLSKPIELLIQTYKMHCQKKNLKFLYTTNLETFPFVYGDEKRLYQIINNLLSNSFKFTNVGFIHLKVFAKEQNEDEIKIHIIVEDTGIGIPEHRLDEIFEKFKKFDELNVNPQGTGIGLAIVKEFVKLMNGNISVQSKVGVGTSFEILLPFKKYKEPINVNVAEQTVEEILETYKFLLENKKILISEDAIEIQLLLKKYLENTGLKYDIVSNGIEVLEKIKKNTYDVILLDLRMPIMDGFETFRQIDSKIKSNTPIAALTAYSSEIDIRKTKELGFTTHISKPIKRKDLILKIIELLKTKERITQNQK